MILETESESGVSFLILETESESRVSRLLFFFFGDGETVRVTRFTPPLLMAAITRKYSTFIIIASSAAGNTIFTNLLPNHSLSPPESDKRIWVNGWAASLCDQRKFEFHKKVHLTTTWHKHDAHDIFVFIFYARSRWAQTMCNKSQTRNIQLRRMKSETSSKSTGQLLHFISSSPN